MIVERILAPNPGFYTGPGTNTYLVADGGHALIVDPGPVIASHLQAIVDSVGSRTPVGVVVTHTHPDHAPLANPLAQRLEVPVYGYEEGTDFIPDVRLSDGDAVPVGRVSLVAVHTPGHTADHLCFRLGDRLFTGDHIMGGSTVVMEDAAAYMASLERIRALDVSWIEPGHGDTMGDAPSVIDGSIAHRRRREAEILAAVADDPKTVAGIVDVVYRDVPDGLRAAATMQMIVQLTKLYADGAVRFPPGEVGPSTMVETDARETRCEPP